MPENLDELGGPTTRLGVAGDSAGGNLAAVACQLLEAPGNPTISRQILLYPCLAPRDPGKHSSRAAYGGDECFLNETGLEYLLGLYRRSGADEADPMLWPSLSQDLGGLPEAYIVTAEFDMLRDEAGAYGRALAEAGVEVTYKLYEGTIHGFVGFAGTIEPGMQALDGICGYLRDW